MTTFAYRTHRLLLIARIAVSTMATAIIVYYLATNAAFSLSRRAPRHHLSSASPARLWTSRIGWIVLLVFTVVMLATEIASLLNRPRNVITITDDSIVIPRHEWSRKTLTIHRDEVRFIERSRPRLDGGYQRCDLSFGTETKRLSYLKFQSGQDFDAFVDQISEITGIPITTDTGW